MLPKCPEQSVAYENVCVICVPAARSKEPLKLEGREPDKTVIYVGETIRSIVEWTRDHWKYYKVSKQESHMMKHQIMEHEGGEVDFVMWVLGSYRTALSRQVSEAMRIRRRGGTGSILNSKTEYNRCHIPILRIEEEEEVLERKQSIVEEKEQIDIGSCKRSRDNGKRVR